MFLKACVIGFDKAEHDNTYRAAQQTSMVPVKQQQKYPDDFGFRIARQLQHQPRQNLTHTLHLYRRVRDLHPAHIIFYGGLINVSHR